LISRMLRYRRVFFPFAILLACTSTTPAMTLPEVSFIRDLSRYPLMHLLSVTMLVGIILGISVSFLFRRRSGIHGTDPGEEDYKTVDSLKAEFISSITHDLKSPLAAIVSYTDFMLTEEEMKKLTLKQVEYIRVIHNQCLNLLDLVSKILDMSKIQAGKMDFLREWFKVSNSVEKARKLFEMPAQGKKVALTAQIAPNIPDVHGDPGRIHQVLTNLVSNALKFTPEGGSITIGARYLGSGQILLFVTDTGPGIPTEELPRMFERFHRINPMEQKEKKIHGTGLGLAICKGIVDAWKGRIWVQSSLGKGTTFSFTVPVSL